MNDPTTVYLARHGQTEWNVARIFQGQDDSPLTELGLQQAHEIGVQFAETDFTAIFSSDIGRAKTTAEIIAQYHKIPVQTSALMRERNFGNFQGESIDLVARQIQEKMQIARDYSFEEHLNFRMAPDVETDQEIIDRIYSFFKEIHSQYPGKKVLTVTHGNLMTTFLIYLKFARYGQLTGNAFDNLGYLVVETDGSHCELTKVKGVHMRT